MRESARGRSLEGRIENDLLDEELAAGGSSSKGTEPTLTLWLELSRDLVMERELKLSMLDKDFFPNVELGEEGTDSDMRRLLVGGLLGVGIEGEVVRESARWRPARMRSEDSFPEII